MNRNVLANIVGRFWSTLSGLIFLPLYIAILGIDAYSVISLSLIVAGVITVLDLGLSATISREMARGDVRNEDRFRVFRAFEKIYLVLLLVCVAGGMLLSGPIAEGFIHETAIDRRLIALCLKIITFEAGLQLFFRFYVNALMGLERQVEANIHNISWGVLRNGFVLAAILISPTLPAFFIWQLAATLSSILLVNFRLASILEPWRPGSVPLIDHEALMRVYRFATGVFLISIVAVVNTQLDRIILSRMLDLRYLGYYTITVSVGSGMLALSAPIQAAIQPRLTRWFSEGRVDEAKALFLKAATAVAILIFPLAAIIGSNAYRVFFTWTGDEVIAGNSAPLAPWVVAAYALLAMQSMTYAVALANGFTRYHNIVGFLALCVSVPGYWIGVDQFGAVGAAAIFMGLQMLAAVAFHVLLDRRFLHLGTGKSFAQLFVCPALAAYLLALGWQAVLPPPTGGRLVMLAYLIGGYAVTAGGTAILVSLLFRLRWRIADVTETR